MKSAEASSYWFRESEWWWREEARVEGEERELMKANDGQRRSFREQSEACRGFVFR
jgi:hypothetical protein